MEDIQEPGLEEFELPEIDRLPKIELIIKGSEIDGKRKGADIFCQVPNFVGSDFSI